MRHRVGRSAACALLLCVVASTVSSCSHGATTAGPRPTAAPTSIPPTPSAVAALASRVNLPASFTPETRTPGLDGLRCDGRCWRSADTPAETLTSLAAAMRLTGLVITDSCPKPAKLSKLGLPKGVKERAMHVCAARGTRNGWTISLTATSDVQHGRVTATGSTVILDELPVGSRYELEACQQSLPCVAYTSSQST
jgi:hypothetical protein